MEGSTGSRTMRRALYALPALFALAVSMYTLLYAFGSEIIYMANTCYRIYVHAPGYDDASFVDAVGGMLGERDRGFGWVVHRSLRGAYRGPDGRFVHEDGSFVISIGSPRKSEVIRFVREMLAIFGQDAVLVEERVLFSDVLTAEQIAEDADGKR